ncbi:MAG: MFS transporter [Rhodobiaceae bacterium]|nr:MFS transporter [Rhodobiaceae bacterium]
MSAPWKALTLGTGFFAFSLIGIAQALFGPSLPAFERAFELGPGAAGLILSAHWVGAFVGVSGLAFRLPAYVLRWRPAAGIGSILIGTVAISSTTSWEIALLGAAFNGCGYGLLTVGFNGFAAASFGERSPVVLNLLNAVFGVGAIGAPLLLVWLGGRPDAAFFAIFLVALVILPFALMSDDRGPEVSDRGEDLSTLFRRYRWILFLMALGVGIEISAVGWGATVLVAQGVSEAEAAVYTSLFYVAFTVMRLAAVGISLFVRPGWLVTAGLLVGGASLFLTLNVAAAPYAFILSGAAISLIFPNMFAWLARPMVASPRLSSLLVGMGMCGGIAIPAIAGIAISFGGEQSAFLFLGGVAFFGAGLAALMIRVHGPEIAE